MLQPSHNLGGGLTGGGLSEIDCIYVCMCSHDAHVYVCTCKQSYSIHGYVTLAGLNFTEAFFAPSSVLYFYIKLSETVAI